MLWKAFLKKGDIKHVPENLSTVAKEIEEFLIKPLNASRKHASSMGYGRLRVRGNEQIPSHLAKIKPR
jgi:hypothetical protein